MNSSSYLENLVDAPGKFRSTNYSPAKLLRTNLAIQKLQTSTKQTSALSKFNLPKTKLKANKKLP